jgi:hypothetical protein
VGRPFHADYGRDYAAALGNGHFAPIANAGHFPQIEQLGSTLGTIGRFVDTVLRSDELRRDVATKHG